MTVAVESGTLTLLADVNNLLWTCGNDIVGGSYCLSMDITYHAQKQSFLFPWPVTTSILTGNDVNRVYVSGRAATDNSMKTDVADCLIVSTFLSCTVQSFVETSLVGGAYVPFVDKVIYVGSTQTVYGQISIVDATANAVRSFIYSSNMMSSISMMHVLSSPVFIGGFVAGTCVSAAGINYIYAGMVRSDSGVMTGMYIAPSSGSILNSAELVNAMALEYANPDSFIAGGIELSDGAGLQAYLLCVNSLYRRVIYGVRYTLSTYRRVLSEGSIATSAVVGMVLVEKALYLLINIQLSASMYIVSILKTDSTTGMIDQQVQIYSHNSSIHCADIISIGLRLFMACTLQQFQNTTTQSVVIAVNRELIFSQLPEGFIKLEQETFVAQRTAFKGNSLPLVMKVAERETASYTFSTADGSPTLHPSIASTIMPTHHPSQVPSGQPSSNPTAAPSVSPQPTSQPSSSGPTNTYKPTVKPTQRPTPLPSVEVTCKPSRVPSGSPTIPPSIYPTPTPSACPSTAPSSSRPTLLPSAKRTRHPTVRSTSPPTVTPSINPTISPTQGTAENQRKSYQAHESAMLGYAVAGLLGLGSLYQLLRWCRYKIHKAKEDKKRVREMLAQNLPGKPRYPIFTATAGLCCSLDIEVPEQVEHSRGDTSAVVTKDPAATVSVPPLTFKGPGAYVNGPAAFVDLEANIASKEQKKDKGTEVEEVEQQDKPVAMNEASQQGDVSDLSEASDNSEVATNHSDDVVLSEESEHSYEEIGSEGSYIPYGSDESWVGEPSDNSDVVYSISEDGTSYSVSEGGDVDGSYDGESVEELHQGSD